jgi:NAD-dependent SIR2 family protein deacetylase
MGTGLDRYLKASRTHASKPAKQLKDGTTVIATTTVHGPKQMRCMHCHGMCGPARDAQGQEVYRCSSCGTTSKMRPI